MKNLDLDKAMTRIKKAAAANRKLVDADTKRKMGSNTYKQMKAQEKLDAVDLAESQSKNAVIRSLNAQVEYTKEGSQEEEKLMNRIKRLQKAQGR